MILGGLRPIWKEHCGSSIPSSTLISCKSACMATQVWDAALRAVCQAWGVRGMPPFAHLMQVAVAGLGRKPVRAR